MLIIPQKDPSHQALRLLKGLQFSLHNSFSLCFTIFIAIVNIFPVILSCGEKRYGVEENQNYYLQIDNYLGKPKTTKIQD